MRSYETENECSLEIEYHNTSIYAPQVLSNAADSFSIGDMNEHAYALANRADREGASGNASVMRVHRIGGEASSREWTSQMPAGENIECVAIGGSDFVAVATDRQLVRVYTLSGVQLRLIAVPGELIMPLCMPPFNVINTGALVSMCAYGQKLCVVYATGVMMNEEQRSIQATKALVVHIEKRGHKTQKASKVSSSTFLHSLQLIHRRSISLYRSTPASLGSVTRAREISARTIRAACCIAIMVGTGRRSLTLASSAAIQATIYGCSMSMYEPKVLSPS